MQLAKKIIDAREADIKKSITRLVKALDDGETPGAYAQRTAKSVAGYLNLVQQNKATENQERALEGRYPAYHALVALLQLVPVRDIASLAPGEKVILSTSPNIGQEQMPDGSDAVFDSYTNEQNLFAAAFAKEHPQPIGGDLGHRYEKRIAALSKPPAKFLLTLSGPDLFFSPSSVGFIAVDSDGHACGDASEMLTVDPLNVTWAKSDAILASASKLPEIPISAESKVVEQTCADMLHHGTDQPPLTPIQAEMIANPDKHDPLSFLVSDGFLAYADASGKNLVACPKDGLFDMNFQKAQDKSFKLPKFLDAIKQGGMTLTDSDAWTVAQPIDVVDADRGRSDRTLLADCLREAYQNGSISIPTAAKLAISEDPIRSADLTWQYGMFGQKYLPYMTRDKSLLRFYSKLNASQLQTLTSGGVITVRNLAKDQYQELQNFVYRSNRMQIVGLVDDDEYGNIGDYILRREVTERMPDGIPIDATISMKAEERDLVFAGLNYGDMTFDSEDTLEDIAERMAAKEAGSTAFDGTSVDWLSGGHSRELNFSFDFGPKFKSTGSLREVVESPERWKMNALPTDLKNRLDMLLVAARRKYQGVQRVPVTPPTVPPR